jgi:hypothetical protein
VGPKLRGGDRVPFAFQLNQVTALPVRVDEPSGAATEAAGLVAETLSDLYDGGFMDPAAWDQSVPDRVWEAFAPDIRARAQRDAASFTLSALPGPLRTVKASTSFLSVRVLVGPEGSAEVAFASVTLEARGQLVSGERLVVTSHATLVLRPVEGRWRIVAYPDTATEIEPLPESTPPSPKAPPSRPGVPG